MPQSVRAFASGVYVFIYIYLSLSVCVSVCLYVSLCLCLCLFLCLSVCLSVSLPLSPFFLSLSLSLPPSPSLSVSVSHFGCTRFAAEDFFFVLPGAMRFDVWPPFVIGRPGYDNWLLGRFNTDPGESHASVTQRSATPPPQL